MAKLWIGRCSSCRELKIFYGRRVSRLGQTWRRCHVGCGGWAHSLRGKELAAAQVAYALGGHDAVKAMHDGLQE